jgi:hypothetical protein
LINAGVIPAFHNHTDACYWPCEGKELSLSAGKTAAQEIINGCAGKKNNCAAKKIGCAVIFIHLCEQRKTLIILL